jgi:flagellar motor switch protein FliN/FliY
MTIPHVSQLHPRVKGYLDLWTRNIAEGLSPLFGAKVAVESVEGAESSALAGASPEGGLWIRLFAGKAGEYAFFLAGADALRLSQLLLGGASGDLTAPSPEGRESVVQFFQQIATMIPMTDWLGSDCEIEASETQRPVWEGAGQAAFRFSTPQGPVLTLEAQLSADFVTALQSSLAAAKKQEKKMSAPPVHSQSPASTRDVNLDLLMDVELEVTLRFGQREVLLGDILKLAPGSVVELDQEVHDPVELLVGSKVIAWGEVVTVDGNYGLRITGLPSREERIESLRK